MRAYVIQPEYVQLRPVFNLHALDEIDHVERHAGSTRKVEQRGVARSIGSKRAPFTNGDE